MDEKSETLVNTLWETHDFMAQTEAVLSQMDENEELQEYLADAGAVLREMIRGIQDRSQAEEV